MPYKPKYCCQCGEKVERDDWKFWTSRRFCQLCATEFGIHDWIPRIAFGIVALFALYGIRSYFQKPEKPPNLVSSQFAAAKPDGETNKTKTVAQVPSDAGVQNQSPPNNLNQPSKSPTTSATTANLKINRSEARSIETAEQQQQRVYFCGAPTKKGTMCSRRVRNGGRCWQHEGQAALMPQEKLLAAQE